MHKVKKKELALIKCFIFMMENLLCQFYKLNTSRRMPALLVAQEIITAMATLGEWNVGLIIYLNLTANYHTNLFCF